MNPGALLGSRNIEEYLFKIIIIEKQTMETLLPVEQIYILKCLKFGF